ncbi:YidC/Oxa1 family membrane protein insertase [Clostridium folliculivorans]|uniref:Membrane protein n=1 Tax=Clostridium folliculivorans TaxID=2886038 RepID=A0A9W6DAI6_9CLOT|nr:YidC/Oxa1 family membrane protein insertase [Clostridium folliculivorans]GKU25259.1 membrane protein [Clostridium folliculivorans]GKU28280.1 membrane protein [Clostridium folliculivorans]
MNIISNLLNSILGYFFNITGDFGIAIILLTLAVRVVLMPLSFKQKFGMQEQQKLARGLEEIKEKYKDNKVKLESETQKYYQENSKSMLGCLTSFLQLPIFFALYNVILKMPMSTATMLVPWVASLKMADNFFIIPTAYVITVLIPNLLPYVPFLSITTQAKISKTNILVSSLMSAIITFKAPIALGLYLITTSLFSAIEEIVFRIYVRRRELVA